MRGLRWLVACALAAVVLHACSFQEELAACAAAEICLLDAGEAPVPQPRYPQNGAGTGSLNQTDSWGDDTPLYPTLTWDSPVTGDPWVFRVQVAACPDGGVTAAECFAASDHSTGAPDAGETSYGVGPLARNTRYYWRVRACDRVKTGQPCGPWSASRYFDVGKPESNRNDFNGDGTSDWAIGEQHPTNAGATEQVFFFSGASPDPVQATTVFPDSGFGSYSVELTGAGDMNGDGNSDVAVSFTPISAPASQSPVYILLGAAGAFPSLNRALLQPKGNGFASAPGRVSRAGDVNGDGFSDLAVAQPGAQRALIFFGADNILDSVSGDVRLSVGTAVTAMTVAPAGDLNGNRLDDVIVIHDGLLSLFEGQPTPGDWTAVPVPTPGAGAVSSVATGDFDGDGYSDFVATTSGTTAGLYRGGRNFFSTAGAPTTFTLPSNATVVSVGDMNGDGRADFAVKASAGPVQISLYSFLDGGAPQLLGTRSENNAVEVAGVGDTDQDSLEDLLVGTPSGAALYYGDRTGLSLLPLRPNDPDVGGSFGITLGQAY